MTEPNSRLIGGPYPGKELFIPIEVSCWNMHRPTEPYVAVWEAMPDMIMMPPNDVATYYEKGKTLNGLRRFVFTG